MPAFEYTAVDSRGKNKKGILEADSARQIRSQLREQQMMPVDVREVVKKQRNDGKVSGRGISVMEMSLALRQLSTLVNSGMPIEECIGAVGEQSESPKVSKMLMAIRSRVLEGHSFAKAIGEYPQSFPDLYRATIDAGEQSGHLDVVLERLAEYAERRQAMRQQTMLAMLYPLIISIIAIAALIGLMTFVVPQVVSTFEHMGEELPALTQATIWFSDFIREHGIAMAIVIALGIIVFRAIFRRPGPKYRLHQSLLRAPIFGKQIRGANSARFASTLSILVASSVPMLNALKVSSEVVTNLPMQKAVENATERVREGAPIAKSLKESGYFPPMLIHLIANGEASGELEAMLGKAADNQERELETTIKAFLGIIEPVMILGMGVMVLVIVIAILLPIFNLNEIIS
jgi:general secretion pathway protein F